MLTDQATAHERPREQPDKAEWDIIMSYTTQLGMNSGSGHTLLMLSEEDLGNVIEKHLKAFFDKYMKEWEQEKPESYLTEIEVQQLLGVTHATLWRWHGQGYLRHVKVGRRCLWKQSDIDKLLNH